MGSFGKEGRHAKVPCETHGSVGDDKKREIREQENAFAQRLMANNDDDFINDWWSGVPLPNK